MTSFVDRPLAETLLEASLLQPGAVPFPSMAGKTVIMLPVEYDFKVLQSILCVADAGVKKLFCSSVITDIPGYPQVALCSPFLGGPQAVMLLEVIASKGARNFIVGGLCGSLTPEMPVGALFVAASAFSDEGVARHYTPDPISYANADFLSQLETVLETRGQKYFVGRMASIDAIFRETKSRITFYGMQNCMAIDMETAALYAAARYHNVKICGLYAVSDVFVQETWQPGFKDAGLKAGRRILAETIKDMFHG